MRSVRDTFILKKGKMTNRKNFSLIYGVNYIANDGIKNEFFLESLAYTDMYVAASITALGCLINKYTNRQKILLKYFNNLEESVSLNIDSDMFLTDIFLEIDNKLKIKEEAAADTVADILLDFSDKDTIFNASENCNMILKAKTENNTVTFSIKYRESVYERKFAEQIGKHWIKILKEVLTLASKKLCDIVLNSGEENLLEWNQIEHFKRQYNYNYNCSIIEILNQNIDKHMDDIAICDHTGNMTYKELLFFSNKVANFLRENEVENGDKVAIIGSRCREMILSILGTLKLGAIYVPIDVELPLSRISYILNDAMPKKIIMLDDAKEINYDEKVLTLDKINDYPEQFNCINVKGEDCAYILYTSGTTGMPKGVIIQHSSVVNLSKWFGLTYDLSRNKNILHMTNISFDVSVEETITTLLNFATIFIIPQKIKLNKKEFVKYIIRNKICIAQFVPVTLKELLVDSEKIDSLKIVICGGDKLDDDLKNDILKKGYNLFNHYGPTEFTVDAISCRCTLDSNYLGYPIANTEAFIIDKNNNLQTFGIAGELCISGAGMSNGYYNKKELAEKKFVWNPFINRKLYKTGDLAIMMPNGNLKFIGRIDQQVKINGLRIELEEIEYYLKKYTKIQGAVVTVINNNYGGKALCAYYKADSSLMYDELKEYLNNYLPQYMIPNHFIKVSEWPVTVNGKIDKKVLSQWNFNVNDQRYVAPQSNIEKEIAHIWKKLLGQSEISVEDEFLNVGGDSLQATILSDIIMEDYNIQIPINKVLSCTIRQMATLMSGKSSEETIVKDNNLILLKKGSDSTKNIFFIHAGNGEAEVFIDLCDNLSVDYYMWGIRADRLDNYSPKNIKLEEIAKKYVQKIESVQKEGSYNIIGWCIGGSIAFEIALQLEKRGKELSFFGMINSFAPDREFWGEVPEFTISTEEDEIGNLPEYSTFKKKYNKLDSIQDIWTKLLKLYEEIELPVGKLKKYVYDDMDRAIPNFDAENIKVQDIVYYINVLRTFDNVRALYMPTRKLKTQCYLFMATEEAAANALLWNKYCEGKINLYNIEGNNFSVLRYPRVLDFSAILNEILEFKGEYK